MKNQYIERNYLKRAAWTVCRFKREVFLKEGGWYLNVHYVISINLKASQIMSSIFTTL